MTLQLAIDTDYKAAFKGKNAPAVSAYRMLKSAIKNREIQLEHELNDDETRDVIAKEMKKRRDAASQYEQAGRPELAQAEQFDVTLFSKYVPAQLTVEELEPIVKQAIAATGATSMQDMGKVMAAVMAQAKGRADGASVQALVKQTLGK